MGHQLPCISSVHMQRIPIAVEKWTTAPKKYVPEFLERCPQLFDMQVLAEKKFLNKTKSARKFSISWKNKAKSSLRQWQASGSGCRDRKGWRGLANNDLKFSPLQLSVQKSCHRSDVRWIELCFCVSDGLYNIFEWWLDKRNSRLHILRWGYLTVKLCDDLYVYELWELRSSVF